MNYEGQVAIVTGAASGIGRALAMKLCSEGATVVVSDIDTAGVETVAADINKKKTAGPTPWRAT